MLDPKTVAKVIDELEKQNSFAKYERDLLQASRNWLKNFMRRKYN